MWDNACVAYGLSANGPAIENVMTHRRVAGTEEGVVQLGSTSKVAFAGAAIVFFGGSWRNLGRFRTRFSMMIVGPNKMNQFRHPRPVSDMDAVHARMDRHAELPCPPIRRWTDRRIRAISGFRYLA